MYLDKSAVHSTTISLGAAVCVNCRIRFSKDNKCWECWQYVKKRKA